MSIQEKSPTGGNRSGASENFSAGAKSSRTSVRTEACHHSGAADVRHGLQLAGFTVHQLPSDGFLVSKWGLTKHCLDEQTLAAFAHQVGVRT